MWTATKVRSHFFGLPENTLVTRRDLLNYGTQDAVDSALRELIKAHLVLRVAWGVYLRPHPSEPLPMAEQIAAVRIAAFHRTKVASALDNAKGHCLVEQGETDLVYEVDAATSKFRIYESQDRAACFVYLKSRVARKMQLELTAARRAIKALWLLGQEQCQAKMIGRACQNFSRADREEFRQSHRLMPGWMSDTVHLSTDQNWRSGKDRPPG